ncbi:asparaginase [Streptomyces vinaceus]|nr:asparaginase [Streptomyces vinaceus]
MPDGSAVALRIADGSHRSRPAVRVAALRRLGGDVDADDTLRDLASAPVLGQGERVGSVRATFRDRRPGPPGAGAHRSSSIP